MLLTALLGAAPRDAGALTIVLDFDGSKTDIFDNTTSDFVASTFGFTGMTQVQVEQAILAEVIHHYLDYPTVSENASSPLANYMQLNINFQIGNVGTAPTNGDSDYYYVAIGSGVSGDEATNSGILGAACYACVRTPSGGGYYWATRPVVGSIYTDHIDNLAGLATTNTQRINLIAGTVSHEIGHTLALDHPGAKSSNPGASLWDLMGSGATSMPNGDRVLLREFSYTNFGYLMTSVGLRSDGTAPAGPSNNVPEPELPLLLGVGLLAGLQVRRWLHA